MLSIDLSFERAMQTRLDKLSTAARIVSHLNPQTETEGWDRNNKQRVAPLITWANTQHL